MKAKVNPQQGTMFYWNPHRPNHQFFFNDRDPKSGVIFTVLYDIDKRQRVKTFQFGHRSFGNSGVCPLGKYFLAINYARMARLRPVTGYKDSYDWTYGVPAPKDDGIAIVNIETGEKEILISFEKKAKGLEQNGFDVKTETFLSIIPFGVETDNGSIFLSGQVGNQTKMAVKGLTQPVRSRSM